MEKIIHAVWLGHGEQNELIKNCIESWHKYLPDYKIKIWNEDNFDLNFNKYFQQAYENRKFAFCSDIVRLYALYTEGGIYLDTDVEVLKSLDEFLNETAFTGFESVGYPVCATMGAEKGNPLIKELLDYYNDKEFKVEDDWTKYKTNTVIISEILAEHGIDRYKNEIQRTSEITVYPTTYFNDKGGYTYHYMNGSWG